MGKPPRSSSGGITCAITMSLTCSVERRYFVLIGQPRPIRVPRSIGSHGSTTQSSSRGSRRSATSAHMACVGYGFGVVNRSRIVPRCEPFRPNQARHRPRTPLRLSTGPRCDPAAGVVRRRGCRDLPPVRFVGATRDVARTYPVSEWNPAAPASRTRWRTVAGASWATKCQMLRPPNSRKIKVNKARRAPVMISVTVPAVDSAPLVSSCWWFRNVWIACSRSG